MKKILCALGMYLCLANLVNAQDFALQQLEKSPRHSEFVDIVNGKRKVHCFVVYPEVSAKATTIIVIHENKGLTDWVRSFADQLAAAGYIVIAPDLLSGFDEKHATTPDFANSQDATKAIYELKQPQVSSDLDSVEKYAAKIPASNGKTAVIGFCWGGGQSFAFATTNSHIKTAMVFYGTPPDANAIKNIKVPVYGFYGGNDQRINATITPTDSLMKAAGKTYEPKIYAGAGHAYMRAGDDPTGSKENKDARDASWIRIKEILAKL